MTKKIVLKTGTKLEGDPCPVYLGDDIYRLA